jgi:hypothetical protein
MATKRIFTLEEANKSLPLVSRIVRDISAVYGTITNLNEKIRGCTPKAAEVYRKVLGEYQTKLVGFVDELEAVGVEIDHYVLGRVLFLAIYENGDRIHLVWKLGYAQIIGWKYAHQQFHTKHLPHPLPIEKVVEFEARQKLATAEAVAS